MEKKYKAYLANLDIEVPVFKVDPKNRQMKIRVSDIPKKLAQNAGISKEEFVTYWYDPGAGGNRLIALNDEPDGGPQRIIDALLVVAEGMKSLSKTRLSRRAIVTLIQAESKVSKSDIELVLNNLESLEEIWLKPIKK